MGFRLNSRRCNKPPPPLANPVNNGDAAAATADMLTPLQIRERAAVCAREVIDSQRAALTLGRDGRLGIRTQRCSPSMRQHS